MKKHLNKKSMRLLAVAVPAIIISTISATIAYNHNSAIFNNKFKLAGYKTLFTETFDAPQNWKTCDTVDKTITVTNDSDSSGAVSVRIKLEEQWLAADGTTELPLVSAASGLTMAQINFTPNSGWTKEGSYYYYDVDLAKGATTTSLISGVTLNCDANLSVTQSGADSAYADGTYHLKITAQTVDADSKDTWSELTSIIRDRANPDGAIDYTTPATIATGNGNGVNRTTENGQDVYAFRGEIEDNHIIWANKCWRIVRTTATGGTKIIYNGTPTDVVVDGETVRHCLADSAAESTISYGGTNTFRFSGELATSPAHVGYMYGDEIITQNVRPNSSTVFFSNDVTRNGNNYQLDTSAGQIISGTWNDTKQAASVKYHYFCTNYATSCDETEIGYITNFNDSTFIYYLPIGGYDDIEDAKEAMAKNEHDSNAKAVVEAWFEQENLDGHIDGTKNYEDELEDAIFCNDRDFASGSLSGKDKSADPTNNDTVQSMSAAWGRNVNKNAQNNFTPSLDCTNKNNAFTKNETATTNGKLKHKVGMITADESTIAGEYWQSQDRTNYLYIRSAMSWTMTPLYFGPNIAIMDASLYSNSIARSNQLKAIRPMVSLKAGTIIETGTGSRTNPFIVKDENN